MLVLEQNSPYNKLKVDKIKMNIIIHNRKQLEFDLADLEIVIKDYIKDNGTIFYLIEVRMET